jgi:hypothetical protein
MKILKIIERVIQIFSIAFPLGFIIWLIITIDLTTEVQHKVEFLQAIAVASAALIGLSGIMLFEIVRNEATILRRLKAKPRDVKLTRNLLSWSIVIGLATVTLVCFWFIYGNFRVMEIAWLLFILQILSPFVALVALNLLNLF